MFCEKCGNQIDENAKFCPNCGNNLSGAQETVVQPPLAPNAKKKKANTYYYNCINSLPGWYSKCRDCINSLIHPLAFLKDS